MDEMRIRRHKQDEAAQDEKNDPERRAAPRFSSLRFVQLFAHGCLPPPIFAK